MRARPAILILGAAALAGCASAAPNPYAVAALCTYSGYAPGGRAGIRPAAAPTCPDTYFDHEGQPYRYDAEGQPQYR